MNIQRIDIEQALPLRQQVLWPDKPQDFCRVAGDESAWHFGVFDNNTLVSVASVYPHKETARLRKFATLPERQGEGIGSLLLKHILAELPQHNIKLFWCDARESAMGFYQRFGLQAEGERFYKSDVPYYKMSIVLS